MGTRSLTFVMSDGLNSEPICCIYRQYDGYPSGHGDNLKALVGSHTIINGISGSDPEPCANGMDCLAAQLVTLLKRDNMVGNIYLCPVSTVGAGQDYEYRIYRSGDRVSVKLNKGFGDKRLLYDGLLSMFDGKTIEELQED